MYIFGQAKLPSISVIIPVKNESAKLRECLDGILTQSISVTEIIVIDSGSTDGTQAIARNHDKVKLIEIPSHEFNHGDTRNLGISHAQGELILFTVGDARATNQHWIEALLAGFTQKNIVGVCGAQVVPHDKYCNPFEWFNPQSTPIIRHVQFSKDSPYTQATPQQKKESASWDDVSAIYRHTALVEIPFKKTIYGEDVLWAIDALKTGYGLAYNPNARVFHFHLEDYKTTLKRTITVCYLRYRAFHYKPSSSVTLWTTFKTVVHLIRKGDLNWKEKIYWIEYNIQSIRAMHTAITLFNQSLLRNENDLDLLHQTYCGTPPTPLKHPHL